jgi:CheY-like chemotaxis protein
MMLHVLLVEDNRLNAELARLLLELDGHDVWHVTCAAELRGAVAAGVAPDIILMDVRLPDGDGAALVQELRAQPRLAAVPIVAVTAHALVGDGERLRAAGFDDVVTKPLDTRTFGKTVAEMAAGSQ